METASYTKRRQDFVLHREVLLTDGVILVSLYEVNVDLIVIQPRHELMHMQILVTELTCFCCTHSKPIL